HHLQRRANETRGAASPRHADPGGDERGRAVPLRKRTHGADRGAAPHRPPPRRSHHRRQAGSLVRRLRDAVRLRRAEVAAALFSQPARALRMSEASAIWCSIEKGIAYLESAQLPSGEIPLEISPTPDMSGDCVREPVVFPAALAARTLSITSSAARVRSRALDFLLREMNPDGLWRHPSSDRP